MLNISLRIRCLYFELEVDDLLLNIVAYLSVSHNALFWNFLAHSAIDRIWDFDEVILEFSARNYIVAMLYCIFMPVLNYC